MKSIKIYSKIILFIIFGNFICANAICINITKEKNVKEYFRYWKNKEINKYKYLAPVFPKELPVDESITISLKNILNINKPAKDDNIKPSENFNYLAPEFPSEIPVDEEIFIYSTDTPSTKNILNNENNQSLINYKNLAPVFSKEIPPEN